VSDERIMAMAVGQFSHTKRVHLRLTAEEVLEARARVGGMDELLVHAEPMLRSVVANIAERPARPDETEVDTKVEDSQDLLQAGRVGLWRAALKFDPTLCPDPDLPLAYGAYLGAFNARRKQLAQADAMAPGRWFSIEDLRVRHEDGDESSGWEAFSSARGVHPELGESADDLAEPFADDQARAAETLERLVAQLKSDRVREIATLVLLDDMSYDEVALQLGTNLRVVANAIKVARRWLYKFAIEQGLIKEWHVAEKCVERADREPLPEEPEDEEPEPKRESPRRFFAVPRRALCSKHRECECPSCLPRVLASGVDVAKASREELALALGERFQVAPTWPQSPGMRGTAFKVKARRLLLKLGALTGELKEAVAV
jgi:DNA-directed RNA polymerase specialized sigma24 family protein